VRCCLIRPLLPLYNSDKVRCAKLTESLVGRPSIISEASSQEGPDGIISPLATHGGTHLLFYLLAGVPDVGNRLLNKLLNSGDETKRLIGAWHVFWCSFRDSAYATVADRLIENGALHRRLAAGVASQAITQEEYRKRAEQQLIRFFNDEDEKVRGQAAEVFLHTNPNNLPGFFDLAAAYIDSRALEQHSFHFFQALRNANISTHELVIRSAEKLLSIIQSEAATHSRHSDLHQIQDLLKHEYARSEANHDLRRRLLDVIDKMLEQELYGTDEILNAHERE